MRPAFDALFAIDDAMADVIAKATDPTLAAIKLAWWRERLAALDQGQVPAEPRLQAAASHLFSHPITGSLLSNLEKGWAELLQHNPDSERSVERGKELFRIAGSLLGDGLPSFLDPAGRLYAAGQLQRLGRAIPGTFLITDLRGIPPRYRPLTGLAVLARRDLDCVEPEATPGRAFALLRHRWTGRIG